MKRNLLLILMAFFLTSAAFSQKTITFLADPGWGTKQDGLIAALQGAGYTVNITYKPFDYVTFNSSDLVIISRTAGSDDFKDFEAWNGVTAPVMVLSTWMVRDNVMRLMNTSVVANADGSLIDPNLITKAKPVTNADGSYDAIFNGVSTDGAAFEFYKGIYDYPDYLAEDFKLDNMGQPLVVLNDDASGAGSVIMARWKPGTEAYDGSGVHLGYRSYMCIGADDDAGKTLNFDNYRDASLKLFLNEVAFLTTLPSEPQKTITLLTDPGWGVKQDGLIGALTDAGYTVNQSYKPFDFGEFDSSGLVIISRTAGSDDFMDFNAWNEVKAPVMVLSTWTVRDNVMRLMNTSVVANADGSLVDPNLITKAKPVANSDGSYDAIFNGVSTDGAPFEFYKGIYDYPDYLTEDFQFDNNGKPLVVLNDDASGAGSVIMARWKPGVEAYEGSGVLQGYRTYMCIGADDDSGKTLNFDNYRDPSLKLFLNEVAFLMNPSTVDVRNLKEESQLTVFPNPAVNGRFTIEMKDSKSKIVNVQLYTITGSQVYNKNYNQSGNISIESGLRKGLYFLKVNDDGNKYSGKIMIW